MPALTGDRVIRLTPDINVLVADQLSRRRNLRASAATMIVDAIRNGSCPAGPVQLVISLPMIEADTNVLARRLGYARTDAEEKEWLLAEYPLAGRAEILVTADLDDIIRGPAIRLQRPDAALFPFGEATLVIAKPSFAAHWLRQGIVPDAAFIAARPEEFPPAAGTSDAHG